MIFQVLYKGYQSWAEECIYFAFYVIGDLKLCIENSFMAGNNHVISLLPHFHVKGDLNIASTKTCKQIVDLETRYRKRNLHVRY